MFAKVCGSNLFKKRGDPITESYRQNIITSYGHVRAHPCTPTEGASKKEVILVLFDVTTNYTITFDIEVLFEQIGSQREGTVDALPTED